MKGNRWQGVEEWSDGDVVTESESESVYEGQNLGGQGRSPSTRREKRELPHTILWTDIASHRVAPSKGKERSTNQHQRRGRQEGYILGRIT